MNQTNFEIVKAALERAIKDKKVPSNKLGLLLVQAAHETGGFNPKVSKLIKYNNFTGIKFVGQKGAYDSLIISPEGNNYAGYLRPDLWANDFIRILSLKRNGNPAAPITANSLQSFAASLKRNEYFTDTTENYLRGLQTWKEKIKNISSKIPFPSGIIPQGSLFEIVVIFLLLTLLKTNQNV